MSYASVSAGLGAIDGCGCGGKCGCGGQCGGGGSCGCGGKRAPRLGQHYERDTENVSGYGMGYGGFADGPPVRIPSPAEVARRMVPPAEPETIDERIQRILRTKVPERPRRSFSEMFWSKVNDHLDSTMSRHGVPAKWRPYVRKAVRAAIEKGSSTLLDRALDETPFGSSTKKAIRDTLKGLSDVKLDGYHLGQPAAGPRFRFECPGADPATVAARRTTLRQALQEGIRLANGAAAALEASTPTEATIRHFIRIFGHRPSYPVAWDKNQPSSASIAKRFRAVARELAGANTLYRCVACTESTTLVCPTAAPTMPCPLNASTLRPYTLNTVTLCPRFWTQSAAWRGGIVLHEKLHQYFQQFFRHAPNDPERRRDNAHCLEAFALLTAGIPPDECDICSCHIRPV